MEPGVDFPSGQVRDELGVHPRSLRILREAMLADVESAEGTGRAAAVEGLENLRQDRHSPGAGCRAERIDRL